MTTEHHPSTEGERYELSPTQVARLGASACRACLGEDSRLFRPGSPSERRAVTSPKAAAEVLVPMLEGLDREHCLLASLDRKHRLIAVTTVSIGSDGHTFMSPREVFRDALGHGASSVIVAHNHPSGDAEPSKDDRAVTRRLRTAGDLLGIDLLDHLVVGSDQWISLAREGF